MEVGEDGGLLRDSDLSDKTATNTEDTAPIGVQRKPTRPTTASPRVPGALALRSGQPGGFPRPLCPSAMTAG